jgi:hypothetical protein
MDGGGIVTTGGIGGALGPETSAGIVGAAVSAACATACSADERSSATLVDEFVML